MHINSPGKNGGSLFAEIPGDASLPTPILRNMPRNRLVTSVVLALVSTFTLNARGSDGSGQAQPLVIKADVKQVLVPVVVTDKKGHHILGLKADDFAVSEDGAPQRIIAFSSNSESAAASVPTSGAASPPPSKAVPLPKANSPAPAPKRTYLVCVDTMHSAFSSFVRVSEALKKFFAQEQG